MMSSGARRRRSQVVVLLLCTTLVPLALLVWLGVQFLMQDRLLEQNQRRDRAERSADLVVGALQRAIASTEQRIAAGTHDWAQGAVALTLLSDRVLVPMGSRLAYLPVVPAMREASPDTFRRLEELEHGHGTRSEAIVGYQQLTRSPDIATKAGATATPGARVGKRR